MKEVYILATKEKYGGKDVDVMAFESEQDAQQVAQQFDGGTSANVFALPYIRDYSGLLEVMYRSTNVITDEAADNEGR